MSSDWKPKSGERCRIDAVVHNPANFEGRAVVDVRHFHGGCRLILKKDATLHPVPIHDEAVLLEELELLTGRVALGNMPSGEADRYRALRTAREQREREAEGPKYEEGQDVWLRVKYLGEEPEGMLPSPGGKMLGFSTGRNGWTLPESECDIRTEEP